MPFASPVVDVTDVVTVIVPNSLGRSLADPIPVAVSNTGSSTAYLGGPEVVAQSTSPGSGGFPLAPGGAITLNVVFTDVPYAVCASGLATTLALMIGRQ
jgi:hypothetical protein